MTSKDIPESALRGEGGVLSKLPIMHTSDAAIDFPR